MAKMTEDQSLATVRSLLGGKDTTKNAAAMRDRLIEVAGDRTKLVQLMDAVGGLPKMLTED
jgi:hypothetical protein